MRSGREELLRNRDQVLGTIAFPGRAGGGLGGALRTLLGKLEGRKVLWLQGWQRIDSYALSGVYCFLEHVLGAVDDDLGCARYGGCDVQFVGAIPWLDSGEG